MGQLVFLIPVSFFAMIAIIGAPLARAAAARIEQRGGRHAAPSDLADRLERIEQAVDSMAVEVERISESQRFMAKLLAGRAPEPAALPPSTSGERARAG